MMHRIGPPTKITATVAPVANTTPGEWDCVNPMMPCLVSNGTGKTIFVLINPVLADVPATTPCNASNHNVAIAEGDTVDISFGGTVNVKTVAVWVPTDGTVANVCVSGWKL